MLKNKKLAFPLFSRIAAFMFFALCLMTACTLEPSVDALWKEVMGQADAADPDNVQSYTVIFNINGAPMESAPKQQTVNRDAKIIKPPDPVWARYEFGGWFKEAACNNEWNFSVDTVNENITLYAKWGPAITWTALADGTAGTVTSTKIDFSFSKDPVGLAADNIIITAGTGAAAKGSLSGSGLTRSLAIFGITEGNIAVSINKAGINPDPKTVDVFVDNVSDITYSITANGSTKPGDLTTKITFSFGSSISALSPALAAGNISLSANTGTVTKGTLSTITAGTVYELGVSGFTNGATITVSINKTGIESGSKTVSAHNVPAVTYSITANGSTKPSDPTTKITLTFGSSISALSPALTAGDISLSANTGAVTRGLLTTVTAGTVYELGVSGFTNGATITVSINKAGIESGNKTVTVHNVPAVTYSTTANGSTKPGDPTTKITFSFGSSISALSPALAAGDIRLSANTGIITKGSLTMVTAGTVYELGVSGFTSGATITVSINKTGIESGSKTVKVYNVITDPDDENIVYYTGFGENSRAELNPGRGWYSTEKSNSVSTGSLSGLKNKNITIVLLEANLGSFLEAPLSSTKLNEIDSAFNAARSAGLSVIFRAAYDYDGKVNPEPKDMDIILNHINQLKPVFAAHEDILLNVQAGFLGPWGEWHSSFYGSGSSSPPTAENQVLFGNALLNAVPKSVSVAFRRPMFIRNIAGRDQPVTEAEAFGSSKIARMAFHNDALMADNNDDGTYVDKNFPRETELAWVNKQTRYTPMIGESNKVSSYSDTNNAVEYLNRINMLSLNRDYHLDVIKKWQDTSYEGMNAYNYITGMMGYRFILNYAGISETTLNGGSLCLNLRITNIGFGHLLTPKKFEVVLKRGNKSYRAEIKEDARFWNKNEPVDRKYYFSLPSDLQAGDWEVYLGLSSTFDSLKNNPAYSVCFANAESWDNTLGLNKIGAISLKNDTIDNNQKEFVQIMP